jgi:hypothetical protein
MELGLNAISAHGLTNQSLSFVNIMPGSPHPEDFTLSQIS